MVDSSSLRTLKKLFVFSFRKLYKKSERINVYRTFFFMLFFILFISKDVHQSPSFIHLTEFLNYYLHSYLNWRLWNLSTSPKLTNITMNSNITKRGLSSFFTLTLCFCKGRTIKILKKQISKITNFCHAFKINTLFNFTCISGK